MLIGIQPLFFKNVGGDCWNVGGSYDIWELILMELLSYAMYLDR